MYQGQIYYKGNSVTIEEAVSLNLIVVDGDGNIWLKVDTARKIKITGDLRLN